MKTNIKTYLLANLLTTVTASWALQSGTVVAGGNNYSGESTVPTGLNRSAATATGGNHSLVHKVNGTVTIPTNDVSAAWSNDVQMVVLFQDEDISGIPEIKQNTVFTTNLNMVLLSQVTAEELLQWQYGGTETGRTLPDQKGTKRTPVQILVIEPLNSRRADVLGQIQVHEYRLDTVHPKPEWHEWLNPRLFLEKWAGYWTDETDATPVVIILFRF